jgi:hypothetical protein
MISTSRSSATATLVRTALAGITSPLSCVVVRLPSGRASAAVAPAWKDAGDSERIFTVQVEGRATFADLMAAIVLVRIGDG